MWALRNDKTKDPINLATANALTISDRNEVCAVWNIGTSEEYDLPLTGELDSRDDAESVRRTIVQQLPIVQLA